MKQKTACDQCRKSKSKCEDAGSGVEDDTCRNCLIAGHGEIKTPLNIQVVLWPFVAQLRVRVFRQGIFFRSQILL